MCNVFVTDARTDIATLDRNDIAVLPADLGYLSSLQHLSLRHNCLLELPVSIWRLHNLTSLWIEDNQILRLPPELGVLGCIFPHPSTIVSDQHRERG
ncbi:hypothetical protein T484DRAFT_1799818 [Baffinella frigidus]|nr:hypothetical protein T484DRAFT_1799818 [Cryptophyta sp. CCMP2293]